jgi:hypothetical protein
MNRFTGREIEVHAWLARGVAILGIVLWGVARLAERNGCWLPEYRASMMGAGATMALVGVVIRLLTWLVGPVQRPAEAPQTDTLEWALVVFDIILFAGAFWLAVSQIGYPAVKFFRQAKP